MTYSSIEEGKSKPMPEQYDGKHGEKEDKVVEDKPANPDDTMFSKESVTITAKTADDSTMFEEATAETVEIPKTEWEEMTKRMKAMEDKGEMLFDIGDRKAKAKWYAAHKEELPPQVKLNTWPTEDGDKAILDWGTVMDQGEFVDPQTGRRITNQQIWIKLEDDKVIKNIPYGIWVERYGQVQTDQVGTETNEKNELMLKLKVKDTGKENTVPRTSPP